MKFRCKVHTPMYDYNGRRYIRFFVPEVVKNRIKFLDEDGILTVKVPYKYRRVVCKFEGAPVQALERDDEVDVDIVFTGVWKLLYIKSLDKYIS